MLELPEDGEGLGWIARHSLSRLLLIPGLLPASITAAAAGDQEALAHLRAQAEQFAAMGSSSNDPLDRVC